MTFLPRHAEFFTTPEQGFGLGTVDWLDGLAVHEFRHVGQFEKARQGVGRVLGPLLGDGALGVAAVGVPQWFFEGDAVGTETALTRSGRGRIPSFNVGLRANLLSRPELFLPESRERLAARPCARLVRAGLFHDLVPENPLRPRRVGPGAGPVLPVSLLPVLVFQRHPAHHRPAGRAAVRAAACAKSTRCGGCSSAAQPPTDARAGAARQRRPSVSSPNTNTRST